MKKLIVFAFLIFILKYRFKEVKSNEYRCTANKLSATASLRLKNQLFCYYDTNERPTEQNKTVSVNLQLKPKFMEFDSRTSAFTLHYWLKMEWNDVHLVWNPGEFEKLNTIYVSSKDIWMPDLSVENSFMGEAFELPETTCALRNTGLITCVIPTKTTVFCESDFTYWPFDEQTCKISSGSDSYYSHEVIFDFMEPPILMEDYVPNHNWLMKRQEAGKIFIFTYASFNYTEIEFEFDLKRHSSMSQSVYVTPSIIFMLFTLMVLWLDSNSNERIALAGVNFICHLYCIYDLHWMVPLNGFTVPHILIFSRDSLILAAFSLIMTIVFRKLQMTTATAPKWIFSVVSTLGYYRLLRFLVINDEESKGSCELEEEIEDNVESVQSSFSGPNKEKIWCGFAKFLEWMSLFSIALTYFILLITLVL